MNKNREDDNEYRPACHSSPPLPPELIAKFRAIVGDKYAVTDAADIAPYVTEERDLFHGRSPLVLRPGSTAEVSAICKLANDTGSRSCRRAAIPGWSAARRRITAKWSSRCGG